MYIAYSVEAQYLDANNYLHGDDLCPVVQRIRGWLNTADAGLLTFWKTTFSSFCTYEDGYWRFFVDAWVRGVLMNSDSWVLLLWQLPRVIFFHVTIKKVIIDPVLSVVHGGAMFWLHQLSLPLPDPERWPKLWKLCGEIEMLSCVGFFNYFGIPVPGLVDKDFYRPPLTHKRKRPSQNFIDSFKYFVSRKTRMIRYFYRYASGRLNALFSIFAIYTLLFRILCITVSLGGYLRKGIDMAGLGSLPCITKYGAAVSARGGMDLSESALRFVFSQLAGVTVDAVPSLVGSLLPIVVMLAPLLVVGAALGITLSYQGKAFQSKVRDAENKTAEFKLLWGRTFDEDNKDAPQSN